MDNEQLVTRIQAGENEAENMLQLWKQNKAFIGTMAWKYSGLAEMEDLEQEGFIGLCEAVRHYEPCKEVPFINYAAFWIRQAMRRYVDNCGAVVRLPSNMYDWIRKYKKTLREYRQEYREWPSDSALCWLMGVNRKKLQEIRRAIRMADIGSLDAPLDGAEDGELTVLDTVSSREDLEEDACQRMDSAELAHAVWVAVDQLPGDLPAAVRLRYQDGMTLQDVGEKLGVNREKVRQMESKALRMLRQPHRSKTFRAYFDEYLAAAPIHHRGLQAFMTTWESEVERDALRGI